MRTPKFGVVVVFLLSFVSIGFGQQSAITSTITDNDGQAWFSGTYKISLYPTYAGTPTRVDNGQSFQTVFQGALDGTGSFSATLTNSNNINPAGTTWQFTICSAVTGAACFSTLIAVNASGSLSSQLSALAIGPRVTGGVGINAYVDVEVAAFSGNTYYNLTTPGQRCYTTTWTACGGSGGGGVTPSTQYQIPSFNSAGTSVAGSNLTTDATGNNLSIPGGATVDSPTGGNEGAGTINVLTNYYIQGHPIAGGGSTGNFGYFSAAGYQVSGNSHLTWDGTNVDFNVPAIHTNTGTYTGSTTYGYVASSVGGCVLQSEINAGQGGGRAFNMAVAGCNTGASSATVNTVGIAGFASSSSTTGLPDILGGYFQGRIIANGGYAFGFNSVATDNGTLTSGNKLVNEIDIDPNSPFSAYVALYGLDLELYNALNTGTGGVAVNIGSDFTGESVQWLEGININTGAALIAENINAANTATSGANYGSPILRSIHGTFYNGTASTDDNWRDQLLVGTGTTPTSKYRLSHTGSTGQASVDLSGGIQLELDGSTSGSAVLGVAATGGTLDLGSTNATVDNSGNLTVNSCTGCGGTPSWSSITSGANAQTGAFSTAAPWTWTVAGAASTSDITIANAPYSGGTSTTNFPLLYLNSGTAPTTLSATGTEIGVNAPTGFTGNMLDFHVNGGTSVFSVNYVGNIATPGGFTIGGNQGFSIGGRANLSSPSSPTNTIDVGAGSSAGTAGSLAAAAYTVGGTTFTVTGCGTATAISGGATAGQFTGGSATCTPVITMGSSVTSAGLTSHWACQFQDYTTRTASFLETSSTATTVTFTAGGTVGATDAMIFGPCVGY